MFDGTVGHRQRLLLAWGGEVTELLLEGLVRSRGKAHFIFRKLALERRFVPTDDAIMAKVELLLAFLPCLVFEVHKLVR